MTDDVRVRVLGAWLNPEPTKSTNACGPCAHPTNPPLSGTILLPPSSPLAPSSQFLCNHVNFTCSSPSSSTFSYFHPQTPSFASIISSKYLLEMHFEIRCVYSDQQVHKKRLSLAPEGGVWGPRERLPQVANCRHATGVPAAGAHLFF